jgi:hypothetical protein
VTAVLEKIRDQIMRGTPAPADFALEAAGTPAVYSLTALTDIVFVRQTGTAPSFSSDLTPFILLSQMAPGAVGAVAFGKYMSPDYLTADRVIPLASTRLDMPQVQRRAEIFFNLVLPAGSPPPSGWPVAIVGHGSEGDKQGTLFLLAAKMAAQGIATIGINAVGRGFGPLGTLTLLRATGSPSTLPAGGRGSDTNGDGQITATEGGSALAPYDIVRTRDGRIQTVADLMQLVRVIEVGMDVDDDGVPDLDPARMYYVGHSFGGQHGAVFLAAEPHVRAGVLVSPGGPQLEYWRLSPVSRALARGLLASRVPSLLNIADVEFNENLPLRDEPPVVNTVPGAVEIQELLDNYEWVGQAGDVVPYAVHLRRAPLEGVAPKAMLIQFARGDRTVPNPTATAILRAGDLADRATYFRFDLFLAGNPTTPSEVNDPHGFIFIPPPFFLDARPPEVRAAANAVAEAAQEQIAVFFASDGVEVIDPDGPDDLFETPIVPPLPEDAVFFP